MFVRYQDGVKLFGLFADSRQTRNNIALAQAGVDEDSRFFGTDESGVSRAAAGEDADLDYDNPPCLFKCFGFTLDIVFTGGFLLPILP
jgi:hypothetical protein